MGIKNKNGERIIIGISEVHEAELNNQEYYIQLNEEYSTPFDEENENILEWAQKDRKSRDYLNDKYGESAWNIHRFMELCRSEKISESFFRQLVRQEMDKCFKNLQKEEPSK